MIIKFILKVLFIRAKCFKTECRFIIEFFYNNNLWVNSHLSRARFHKHKTKTIRKCVDHETPFAVYVEISSSKKRK